MPRRGRGGRGLLKASGLGGYATESRRVRGSINVITKMDKEKIPAQNFIKESLQTYQGNNSTKSWENGS
jgi:hypothetical protein